jgi:hypothetical protein
MGFGVNKMAEAVKTALMGGLLVVRMASHWPPEWCFRREALRSVRGPHHTWVRGSSGEEDKTAQRECSEKRCRSTALYACNYWSNSCAKQEGRFYWDF